MNKTPEEIYAGLLQPFAAEDLEWRLQKTLENELRGLAVPYVTNRAIQNRLDAVMGPENWRNEFVPWHSGEKKPAQLCGLSLYFEGRGWVTKWDGAENTAVEPIKGGLSDAMKRSAVQWGVGRILYNLDNVWVDVEKKGKSVFIAKGETKKLDQAYLSMLKKLNLTPADPGGMQALLVPTEGAETEPPQQAEADAPTPPRDVASKPKQSAPADEKIAQFPAPPEFTHLISQVNVQKGMSRDTTYLSLEDKDRKKISAFVNGKRDELQAGVCLRDVVISSHVQDNVVFNVLESYTVVPGARQAA